MMIDRTKSLEQLENVYWGPPEYNSNLVINCHKYRKIPLKDLTVEQLRLQIGQNLGLKFLIPVALDKLLESPFAEGDCYPGDLLHNVLKSGEIYWKESPKEYTLLREVCIKALNYLRENKDSDDFSLYEPLLSEFEKLIKQVLE